MEPIRILYVNGGIMSRGGIESYMMNYYRNLDRDKIQIDFIVHGFEKGVYDDEIKLMGGRIYNVPVKSKDYIGNIKALRKIFLSGQYKIVHSHMDAMSTVVLKEAKKCGIPIRIAHSHNTQHLTNSRLKFILNEYARKNIKKYATHLFACSEDAGKWLFGKKSFDDGKVKIINNAIDLNKFKFDIIKRQKIRNELGIKDEFVIGHVGRFDYQKNHSFLLDIFKGVLEKLPKSKLILVGDGHLKNEIFNKIKKLNIKDNVIILGLRDDVNEIINAFDIFILPSLFEGLGIVGVEAQTNGLQCVLSDVIPKEIRITENVEFISLNENPEVWVEKVVSISKKNNERQENSELLKFCRYDINTEAKKLQKLYFDLLNKI